MLRFAFRPRHPVTRVAFTADGSEVITAQPFTSVAVRDRLTGVARWTHDLSRRSQVLGLEVHPTLGGIVVHSSGRAELLDPTSGKRKPELEGQDSELRYVPEMLLGYQMWWRGSVTGERVQLQLRERGSPLVRLGGHVGVLSSRVRVRHIATGYNVIQFAPDGTMLALCDGETLGVFDLQRLEGQPANENARPTPIHPNFTLERPDPTRHGTFADRQADYWLPPVAFDHAGRSLLTLGLRNRVQRIELATGGVMAEWGWRCEPIRSMAVSPDDLTAAAGCQRGELVVWDLE